MQLAALSGSGAYELTESLAIEVGPRFAGSPGDRAGVAWALVNLRELGFETVWSEPVAVPQWVRGKAAGELLDPYPRDVVLAALGGSVATPADGLVAEVVEFENLEALSSAAEGSLEGKIAYVSDRMERRQDARGYGPAVGKRSRGAVEAAKKGAVAVLIRSVGTSKGRFAHTGAMRYDDEVEKIPAAALSNADADVLSAALSRHQTVRFRLELLTERLPDVESASVFAEIAGDGRADEIVLLACHLDSWDLGQGAVDDGAGCGIIMATLKLLADHQVPLARTVRIGLFANEEFGLSGARAYGERDDRDRHVIGVESDLGAGRIWQFDWRVDPAAEPAMRAIAAELASLEIAEGTAEAFGGADLSPLMRQGMPVVSLRQDAARYFDLHHTANDTIEQVEASDLDQNVAAYLTFTLLAANYDGSFGRIELPERR